ncbi:unnamed protein product [Sphagnum compactum]
MLHNDNNNRAAVSQQQQHVLCRLCNRGFSSGAALRGHYLRAHGGGSPSAAAMEDGNARTSNSENGGDKEHQLSSWTTGRGTYLYILRMNPKRSQRFIDQDCSDLVVSSGKSEDKLISCTECNKKFGSMKALFGHMRCHPERYWRGIQPPDRSTSAQDHAAAPAVAHTHHGSYRRKKRSPPIVLPKADRESESEMNSKQADAAGKASEVDDTAAAPQEEEEEESPSTPPTEDTQVQKDIVFALMLLHPQRIAQLNPPFLEHKLSEQGGGTRMMYQCATCKRIFKSHQALGGHRASHKKPCDYLVVAKGDNEEMLNAARKTKGHECSICHRVFNSGQALGGHKRCHWEKKGIMLEGILDLNMPAPECAEEMPRVLSPWGLTRPEVLLVF